MASIVRLFLDHPLGPGERAPLSRDQAHYLFGVMRREVGSRIEIFNGRDGAWEAEIAETGKRGGAVTTLTRTAPQSTPPDLWLLFAPIKKARTDFIVEKAAEMGARRICPVQTERTNAERIRRDRLQAHAVEAAEQCGGTFVPEVAELMPLGAILEAWPGARRLMFCDEALAGGTGAVPDAPGPWAILVGPEGGFSDAERARLGAAPYAYPVALGPRILRADTAAVAAMTIWQSRLGDWG